jgi:hypothetical protein
LQRKKGTKKTFFFSRKNSSAFFFSVEKFFAFLTCFAILMIYKCIILRIPGDRKPKQASKSRSNVWSVCMTVWWSRLQGKMWMGEKR